ncbi:MAG TPA: UvrD-helicase domain-containing protein [Burkholderiales bacterium]|nr:UvrD-helicase domain-containing protein [Burkholderiales bacterium]
MAKSTAPVADAAERERALDPSRSFIVQAPAGSGKTELLVRRYLRLLKAVERPEEVLAITFTRKAAAEMRKRVFENLPEARDLGHRLRILTIDALCASLTRQMPVLSRFGAQPELVEDAREHYREAGQRTLRELGPEVERLLAHLDNNVATATGLLAAMLAKRDQWLRKTGLAPTRGELEATLAAERARLLAAARELHPAASVEMADAWLTEKKTWKKRPATPPELMAIPGLREALVSLQGMPPERYTDEQWEVLEAILKLLPLAAAHLKLVFGERGEADFTEVAQGAVRALGTPEAPTDLLLAFDYRVKHILVDEFQDTSLSQWELLALLTSEWIPGDGRTLFLVGDPMQSIYRFREAQVALFLQARAHGLGNVKLEPITLSTNFRSQKNLIAFFNASFERILPAAADPASGAVPYAPAVAQPASKALPGEAATWHALPDREAEARRVVELVREAKERPAILVRRRDALADIVPALKAAGIRYRAIEIEHLGEKQVVQDLYALTRALSHLADRIAWLSILRAPWVGLSLNELFEIAGQDRYATIWELIQENEKLARFRAVLAPALANRARGTLRERVEGVWLALGGPACVESATDLEDAEIYLDELESLERAGDVEDLSVLDKSLRQLYALPDLEATEEDLQILTIHKAKGLEFGTVIVPGLDKGPGRADMPLFLWKETVEGLLLAPIKQTGAEPDPAYRYLRSLDVAAEDTEAARLLYVAATRAEQRLHLLACTKCDDEGVLKPPSPRSLLARAWPVAEAHYARMVPEQLAMDFMHAPRLPFTSLTRLAVDVARILPPEPVRWKAPPEAHEEAQIEFSWAGETARHVGSVVHRWLQRIAEDELAGWDEKRVRGLVPRFSRELERRGLPRAEALRSADLVAAALANALSDERGRWLLGPHLEARNEYRLRAMVQGQVRTYIIDRLFTAKDHVEWVVDYKTSRHEGTGLEAFLDRERDRYTPQLKLYGALRKGSRQGLYFPVLRGWREVV